MAYVHCTCALGSTRGSANLQKVVSHVGFDLCIAAVVGGQSTGLALLKARTMGPSIPWTSTSAPFLMLSRATFPQRRAPEKQIKVQSLGAGGLFCFRFEFRAFPTQDFFNFDSVEVTRSQSIQIFGAVSAIRVSFEAAFVVVEFPLAKEDVAETDLLTLGHCKAEMHGHMHTR